MLSGEIERVHLSNIVEGGGGEERGWTSVDEFAPDCLLGACEKAPQMQICPKTLAISVTQEVGGET